jgi:hypothetical protein
MSGNFSAEESIRRIGTWSMSLGTMTVKPSNMSAKDNEAMKWWLGRRRCACIWGQFDESVSDKKFGEFKNCRQNFEQTSWNQ